MSDKEMNITYETLFELLRREKNREELQKLEPTFFSDVVEYIKEKLKSLEEQKTKQDLFVNEEREKAEKQMENILKILKELYEKRERKMIEMAIDDSRTTSFTVDTSAMLEQEKKFYDNVLNTLNNFRQGILLNIQNATSPEIKAALPESSPPASTQTTNESESSLKEKAEEGGKKEVKLAKVKFSYAVPRFVGPDLEEYGPFDEGNSAKLPLKIVDILVNKGRVEEE